MLWSVTIAALRTASDARLHCCAAPAATTGACDACVPTKRKHVAGPGLAALRTAADARRHCCAISPVHWQGVLCPHFRPLAGGENVGACSACVPSRSIHAAYVDAWKACGSHTRLTRGSVCALRVVRDLHQPVPSALRTAADTWLHACAAHPNHCGCLLVYLQASMLRVAMLGCKLPLLVEVRGSEQLPAIAARPWSLH